MGRIRKAILNKEKEEAASKARKITPRKEEEWDVTEEGFHRDEVDEWNEGRGHMMLDPSIDIEPASFSEDEDDSETEVLPLNLEDESGEDNDSDIFEPSDTELGPSDKAWGQRKSSFYDTEFVGDESLDSSEESLAEEEEKEAVSLQKRMMESLEYSDYGMEVLKKMSSEGEVAASNESRLLVKKSLSEMNDSEKLTLLNHQWPEFLELYKDLEERLVFIKDKIDPLAELVSAHPQCFTEQGATLILAYKRYHHLYCTNVMLYLTMRASQLPAEDHPVIKRIVELREVLGSLRTGLGDIDDLLDVLENTNMDELTEEVPADPSNQDDDDTLIPKGKRERSVDSDEDPLEYYKRIKAQKKKKRVSFNDIPQVQNEEDEAADDEMGKRAITYQIAQNKGLTPKRKKELRNPRVKHRNKFVKAVKKYQKVVRPVERELARYGGERGGIKSRLSRSVKLK